MSPKERQQAAGWALETMDRLGYDLDSELVQSLHIEWAPRHTASLGDAVYIDLDRASRREKLWVGLRSDTDRLYSRVRLSVPLWPRATEAERHETVVHEICHLVVHHEHPEKCKPHGVAWQATMLRAGLTPRTTHTIDRTGLRRKQKRYRGYCGCPEGVELTKQRVKKMLSGISYSHTKCGQTISLKEKS
jgi:predicted SprT family Zn-dependent metalloprotease